MSINALKNNSYVVALGGGHGLGRVMSSLSFLGSKLTGIVTTTDNGGSTGRLRRDEGGIAWGDARNCINQLITEHSIASAMFEYRFNDHGELPGHNLGNLMLKALDNLSIRPLDAINLIRSLLKIDAFLIPMSEIATDLIAIDHYGILVHGEVDIDKLEQMPQHLMVDPVVDGTTEAINALKQAQWILIGPGSFITSLLPPLLLSGISCALKKSKAPIIYIDNLSKEQSCAASKLTLVEKLELLEKTIGGRHIDAVITPPTTDTTLCNQHLIIQQELAAIDIPYRHDRELLKQALSQVIVALNKESKL